MGRTGALPASQRHRRLRGRVRQARRLGLKQLLALAAVVALAGSAVAQSLIEERRALTKAKSDAVASIARAARLETEAANALDTADKARAQAAALAARIQSAEAATGAAEARIAIIDRLRIRQRADLAAKQGPTIRLVAALQMLGRRPPVLALVQPGSVSDLVHVRATLSAIIPVVRARTIALRGEVARGRQLQAQANGALSQLQTSQRSLIEQRRALAVLFVERRRTSQALSGSALIEQDSALALGEEARDIAGLMARMGNQATQRASLETLPGPLPRPIRPGQARRLPVENSREARRATFYRLPVLGQIMTGFGEVSAGGSARGLTIATRPGAQIVAPSGGRIAYAGRYRGFDDIVIIDHGRGWTSLVTNLASLDVRVGDPVDQGSPLGRAKASRATVTVELRHGNKAVDIARLIG